VAAGGAAAVEALDDAEDVVAADAAMDEYEAGGRTSWPYEQVRAEAEARDGTAR